MFGIGCKCAPCMRQSVKFILLHLTKKYFPRVDTNYEAAILNTNAIIYHDGTVELVSHALFQSTCDLDILWYPFDQQDCKLHFAPWTYDHTHVSIEDKGFF